MSVKRYSIGDDIYVRETAQGNWVKHSDYAALAAENAGLRKISERAYEICPCSNPLTCTDCKRITEALSRKAAP